MQPTDFPMFLWQEEGALAVWWDVVELYKANSLNTLEAPCLALGLQSDGHEMQVFVDALTYVGSLGTSTEIHTVGELLNGS